MDNALREVLLVIASKLREASHEIDKFALRETVEADSGELSMHFEAEVMGKDRKLKAIAAIGDRLKCEEVGGYGMFIVGKSEMKEQYRESYERIFERLSSGEEMGNELTKPVRFP